jgi:signal transduction histidine kinase
MSKPIVLFYILVTYVLLQFAWWAYLLINLNLEIFQYKVELLEFLHSHTENIVAEKAAFYKSLKSRWAMVLGEGVVFMTLLIIGINKTKNAFKKEFALAKQQKNFLLSITHEFKSPLAAVKLNLQTLQKRKLESPQKEEIIRRALLETERIHLLIENALMASRLESHNYEHYFEEINLSSFLRGTIDDYIDRQDHEFILNHDLEDSIYIKGDKFALTSLIYNLIENAEKYSEKGTKIEIELKSISNKESQILVKDQGYGIPADEKVKVFEKFYRIGNEDTRKTKGTGLGLFIVQHVVNLHKGKIIIKDNIPQGTVFEINLPTL